MQLRGSKKKFLSWKLSWSSAREARNIEGEDTVSCHPSSSPGLESTAGYEWCMCEQSQEKILFLRPQLFHNASLHLYRWSRTEDQSRTGRMEKLWGWKTTWWMNMGEMETQGWMIEGWSVDVCGNGCWGHEGKCNNDSHIRHSVPSDLTETRLFFIVLVLH